MTRTIEAPGVQNNEIDRSNYERTQDYSIVGTTVLACGYADKGNDYTAEWINSIQTYEDVFGIPTNEIEQYFYNAAAETLDRGGVFVGVKLPYSNSMNGKYKYVDYEVTDELNYISDDVELSAQIAKVDSNIQTYLKLSCTNARSLTLNDLDDLMTGSIYPLSGKIRIVDITHSKYSKLNNVNAKIVQSAVELEDGSLISAWTNDCLGIVPVIVTPMNAMYEQGMFDADCVSSFNAISSLKLSELQDNNAVALSDIFSPLSADSQISSLAVRTNELIEAASLDIQPLVISSDTAQSISYKVSQIAKAAKANNLVNTLEEARLLLNECKDTLRAYKEANVTDEKTLNDWLTVRMQSDDKNDMTLSRYAAQLFPNILYDSNGNVSMEYMKQIGVIVFQAYQDFTNDGKISFKLLENFVGSLDRNATDESGKSLFIDDIINNNSNTIRLFSHVNPSLVRRADTSFIRQQNIRSIGFYQTESAKKLVDGSVEQSLTIALQKYENSNVLPIDLVVDAGMTNIAQLVKSNCLQSEEVNFDVKPKIRDYSLELNNRSDLIKWNIVFKQFNKFCQNTRKDCQFIGDGPRALCLKGDQKLVRDTDLGSSVQNTIIPKLRIVAGNAVNSSYSACYCNWIKTIDAKTNEYLWIPPSIKALGCYVYTDAYFHSWDAPAGMIRGRISNAVDTAFNPNTDEAGRIYSQGFNYAMNYPIDGIVIEGQKTMQLRKTAFDRVNVRRLFLTIEKQIGRIGKYFLYQGNTQYTRQRFTDQCKTVLDAAVNGGGIAEYAIKCDQTNNPPEVIDRNELHCRIAVKPVKTIEYIILDFICSSQSANVTEEVVK